MGHHTQEVASDEDCLHVDCGDCSAEGLTSRHSAANLLAEVSFDDAVALPVTRPPLARQVRVSSGHSPPLPLARPADSPVRRFDKMLD